MNFETEAYLDEYVIDGENAGVFAGDDRNITYTPENQDISPPVSIPTDEITSITIRRDTTLSRNRFLGWFFAGITLALILTVYLFSFAGPNAGLTNPDVDFTTGFLLLLILGGISTTYEYFNGENYDVIVVRIETDDDESYVFTGRIKNTDFVEACDELLECDLNTKNLNRKLETELAD